MEGLMRDSTRANLIIFWSGDEAEGRMTSLDTVDPERLYPNCKWTTRYNTYMSTNFVNKVCRFWYNYHFLWRSTKGKDGNFDQQKFVAKVKLIVKKTILFWTNNKYLMKSTSTYSFWLSSAIGHQTEVKGQSYVIKNISADYIPSLTKAKHWLYETWVIQNFNLQQTLFSLIFAELKGL